MFQRRDVQVILAILAAAVCLLLISRQMPSKSIEERKADATMAPDAITYVTAAPENTSVPMTEATVEPAETTTTTPEPAVTVSEVPEATENPETTAKPVSEAFGPMPAPMVEKVRGYVVLTVHGRQYGNPIPMDRDKIITIRQETGEINRVHITPESVHMESSTCENQDCVGEGIVTLENYKTRILGAYIICLPNAVQVELVPAE